MLILRISRLYRRNTLYQLTFSSGSIPLFFIVIATEWIRLHFIIYLYFYISD